MDKQNSNLGFNLMSFGFKFRDLFSPRINILKEVGIEEGFQILDYGCGPGSYAVPAAVLVGINGKVFALDIHPLAIRKVQNIISKKRLTNVETILSDCKTGLPDNSMNVVLLYDVFHVFDDPNSILSELHRILKPDGILSFSDHHMKENEILDQITERNSFELSNKNQKTFSFIKK